MAGPKKIELAEGVVLCAYRLVITPNLDPKALEPSFFSNKRKGKPPRRREIRCPAIWDGLSCYFSPQGAQDLYAFIAPALKRAGKSVVLGEYVAELRFEGGIDDVCYMDPRDPTGHFTIWGDPLDLAAAVVDIQPVQRD